MVFAEIKYKLHQGLCWWLTALLSCLKIYGGENESPFTGTQQKSIEFWGWLFLRTVGLENLDGWNMWTEKIYPNLLEGTLQWPLAFWHLFGLVLVISLMVTELLGDDDSISFTASFSFHHRLQRSPCLLLCAQDLVHFLNLHMQLISPVKRRTCLCLPLHTHIEFV